MNLRSMGPEELHRFLSGRRRATGIEVRLDLDSFFCQILTKANEFVPSEAGSILLLEPPPAGTGTLRQDLIFVACYGEKAARLVAKRIPVTEGIAGRVVRTGKAYISRQVAGDQFFARGFASPLGFAVRSIICAPIRLEGSVCGAIELLNRHHLMEYNDPELGLLEVFAGYISTAMKNLLDARYLKEMARRDDLTGLSNDRWLHHCLEEEAEVAWRERKDLSLIFFDLDNFKSVNDRFGHLAGSQTLREMGPLVTDVMDSPGAVLARYGGDEFVVLLPGVEPEDAMAMADRLRGTVQEKVFLRAWPQGGDRALAIGGVITVSIGVQSASRIADAASAETLKERLLRDADTAMYRAKALGKNQVVLFSE